jgi:hypothetical protein
LLHCCGLKRVRVIPLLEVIFGPFFAAPTDLSFAGSKSAASEDLDCNVGLVVGVGRRKARFVRYPDGEFRAVDRDFDPSVFDDPDSFPATERRTIQASVLDVPNELLADDEILVEDVVEDVVEDLVEDSVRTIAESMLTARPRSLVAVAHDSRGSVLGATITPIRRGFTPARFRASFRSLPAQAKQVTFATGQPIPPNIQKAVSELADVAHVRVIEFLVIE